MTTRAEVQDKFAEHASTIEGWLLFSRTIEEKYGVTCVLAGGCLRDLLLGRPIKDVDVFVIHKPGGEDVANSLALLEEMADSESPDPLSPRPKSKWRKVSMCDYPEEI